MSPDWVTSSARAKGLRPIVSPAISPAISPTISPAISPAISPTSFYPLIGGVASAERAERMVKEHLTNASEFCVRAAPSSLSSSSAMMAAANSTDGGGANGETPLYTAIGTGGHVDEAARFVGPRTVVVPQLTAAHQKAR